MANTVEALDAMQETNTVSFDFRRDLVSLWILPEREALRRAECQPEVEHQHLLP